MVLATTVDKKLNPESIRFIKKEIDDTDNVISFISSIVYGTHTVRESRGALHENENN